MSEGTSTAPLALLGGTFDPVHYGHLRSADEARRKLGLETLALLPSANPPHRDSPRASTRQRLDMLQLAVQEFPGLYIDDRETRRKGPSYMLDTLHDLRQQFPLRPLILLLGQDAANQLQGWHSWLNLFEFCHFVILTRPASALTYPSQLAQQLGQRKTTDLHSLMRTRAGCVFYLEVTAIDISASGIQNMIHRGQVPVNMIPRAVAAYIERQGLYS